MAVARYKPAEPLRPFQKGKPKPPNTGRKLGTPNKTTKLIKDALTGSAEQLGMMEPIYRMREITRSGRKVKVATEEIIGWKATGKGGMTGYLVWLGQHYPRSYSVLLGRLLPIQVNAKMDIAPTVAEKFSKIDVKSMTLAEKMATMKEMIGLTQALPAPRQEDFVEGEFSEVSEDRT